MFISEWFIIPFGKISSVTDQKSYNPDYTQKCVTV